MAPNNNHQLQRAVIMAGGTGGHVFPALAVAKSLQAQGVVIDWLGTARGIESTLVPAANIPLHCIKVEGVRGKNKLSLLLAPFKIMQALWQAGKVLKALQPDVVVGFGGFASGPGGLMAKILGIPLLIHEQNATAGSTNKLLRPIATKVMQAFAGALHSAEVVGNPVREEISAIAEPATRFEKRSESCNLLVLGGSLGAKAINECVPEALALMPLENRPNVWHQTGRNHGESTQAIYKNLNVNDARVEPFIDDMAAAYDWADIIICRAGALTVSEIMAAGVASILIPYPWAIDDHQAKNASVLVDANAALMFRQESMNAELLLGELSALLKNKSQLLQMANNARTLAQPLAANKVANACLELMNA